MKQKPLIVMSGIPVVYDGEDVNVKFKDTGKQVVVPATQTAAGIILKWDIAGIVGTHTITAGDLSAPSGLTLTLSAQ